MRNIGSATGQPNPSRAACDTETLDRRAELPGLDNFRRVWHPGAYDLVGSTHDDFRIAGLTINCAPASSSLGIVDRHYRAYTREHIFSGVFTNRIKALRCKLA